MALKSSRVVSSSSCPVTTTLPVTISCPAPTAVSPTAVFPTAVLPTAVLPTAVFPTAVCPTAEPTAELTNGADVNALLAQLGLCATAGVVSPVGVPTSTLGQVCINPLAQLGGVNPLAALIAINPAAALAALGPALGIFNPAINANAGLQAFNPACTPNFPFGKFFKKPNWGKCFNKPDWEDFCKKPFGI